jgi:tyrosinase
MYLGFFEQIVRSHIVALGGPDDWALPYWNYSDANNPDARFVRREFLEDVLPDGLPNSLAQAERGPTGDGGPGDFDIEPSDTDLSCLLTVPFRTGRFGVPSGFGGPRTGFQHGGGVTGDLERVPHGAVHSAVSGWMGSFATAGLDPLFWLHHANIDRLWEVWLNRGDQFENPSDPSWGAPSGTDFDFHDSSGATVTLTADQVVDIKVPLLSYQYEDISDPMPTAGLMGEELIMEEGPAMLVGASEEPIRLSSSPISVNVQIDPSAAADTRAALAAGEPSKAYLNLENIVGSKKVSSYKVFVNAPESDPMAQANYAGLLPMFGLVEASRRDDPHGGSGLTYVLDITDIVNQLKQSDKWDDKKLQITFVPKHGKQDAEGGEGPQVGRVSLYYR